MPLHCTLRTEVGYICKVKTPDPSQRRRWLGSRAGAPQSPRLALQKRPCARLRVTNNLGGKAQVMEVLRRLNLCYQKTLRLLCIKGLLNRSRRSGLLKLEGDK